MGEPTDEELMGLFCQGKEVAFETLFERHAANVHSYLRRIVRHADLAEDLLQMTFLSVVRSRDRYVQGSPVAPWIFSIAANAARDVLRRDRRLLEAMRDEPLGEAITVPMPDPGLARKIEAALAELPLRQREIVVLHHVLGWRFEEIAQAVGANATTVRVQAHRAGGKLRALLGHLWEGEIG
jgi:RNA polymerase sigma-70 factor (ECF subfamily)